MRDKKDQEQLHYYWGEGNNNDRDYHTKRHRAVYHQQVRPRYLAPRDVLTTLKREQGKPLNVF